jgi:hypothetical protein
MPRPTRHHALVRVPDVHHAIGVLARRPNAHGVEQIRPVVAEQAEGALDLLRPQVLLDQGTHPLLVDRLRAGRIELGVGRVLPVPENEDDLTRLARTQLELDVMRADRGPSVRDRVSRPTPFDDLRPIPSSRGAEEGLSLRIEAGELLRAREVREMVPPLPVLGDVVDHASHHFDLAGREVALEVRLVIQCVPEAELDRAEQGERGFRPATIRDPCPPDLERLAEGHEGEGLGVDPTAPGADDRVPHPVTASVVLEIRSHGLPRRRPVLAVRPVEHIEVAPPRVGRDVVVPVARQPPEASVTVEGVPPCRVGDDPEVLLAAEVIDPRQRRVRTRDDVLASLVVEVAEPRQGLSAGWRSSARSRRRSAR